MTLSVGEPFLSILTNILQTFAPTEGIKDWDNFCPAFVPKVNALLSAVICC